MSAKALDLFQAYDENKLPKEGGYIVSSFFSQNSTYSQYEVVAYNGVKNIHLSEEGLTFQTDGNKLFVLVEPSQYPHKYVEPFRRSSSEQIPHRFSELNIIISKNQSRVMISKEAIITYSSFTILRPTGMNFSLLFYNLDDVMESLEFFFTQTLNKEAKVPQSDSKKASKQIIETVKRFTIW
jgi:hypothetical protein